MGDFLDKLIPLAGIFMIICVVVGPIWISSYFKSRERQRLHDTLRLMVENGQPVSGELLDSLNTGGKPRKTPNDLRRGVILTSIGVGLAACGLVAGLTGDGDAVGPFLGLGAFPGFIGLGFVILALVSREKVKD
jgi:hypothetical protein